MQTIQLDIKDDKLNTFLTIINNLKSDIIENIRIGDDVLDIEEIERNSDDYLDLEKVKSENNKKYSIDEAKTKLGL